MMTHVTQKLINLALEDASVIAQSEGIIEGMVSLMEKREAKFTGK